MLAGSEEALQLDLEQPAWQIVEILLMQFGERPIEEIGVLGNLRGQFFLDGIRLVGARPGGAANTAVSEERTDGLPQDSALDPNCPNSFNSGTTIRFALSQDTAVELAVYNMA